VQGRAVLRNGWLPCALAAGRLAGELGRGGTAGRNPLQYRFIFLSRSKFPYFPGIPNKVLNRAMKETRYFKGFLWLPNRALLLHALIKR
jgi:hypothetical protein